VYALLGHLDVMLNQLAAVREQLTSQKNTLKAADTATAAKIQSMIDDTDTMVAALTSSPKSFEDDIQKQGQIREDVMSLINDEPLAQSSLELYARLENGYADKVIAYDAWAAKVVGWNAQLKSAGLKAVPVPTAMSR